MDLLKVKGSQIVDAAGQPVQLRGTCVGGWMNLEEFINGYPGAEHQLRAMMAETLGLGKAQFFFDRMADYFFAEEDAAYLRSLGANLVRLPLNYRHFESDSAPFEYLEAGFKRLDEAIAFCARQGLYVILDLHAVQGWQNTDWHCDNASRHTYFWQHPHFQERFYALWQEFARRYKGNPAVAGYNIMNEPVTCAPYGRFHDHHATDWPVINRVYRTAVGKIRQVDPDHIIFLEGDYFSSRFEGLDAPFAPDLVYSSHNYTRYGFGPGPYPGDHNGETWDLQAQRETFQKAQGTQYTQKHGAPLWVGEFGAAYNGPAVEVPDRLRAMDDQLLVYNEGGAHWTTWTYKDIHVMGWVQLDPNSAYIRAIRPVLDAKTELQTDFWMGWVAHTPTRKKIDEFAGLVEEIIQDPTIDSRANQTFTAQHLLSGYVAGLMQSKFAQCFAAMSEEQLDETLQSFALKNCIPHEGLVDVLKKRMVEK
jgi:aryl-phospho-beta-D-glucosidase BglC (GH1 family)